jgi:hypothetical protein
MTRAQQTVSIGLLVTSVRKPLLSSLLIARYPTLPRITKADRIIVLPCSLPTTHSTSRLDFRTDHSSCTLCLFLLKILVFLVASLPTLIQRQTDRPPFLLFALCLLKGCNLGPRESLPLLPKISDRSSRFSPYFDLSAST